MKGMLLYADGLMKTNIFFLKSNKLSEFFLFESRMFLSIIVEEKEKPLDFPHVWQFLLIQSGTWETRYSLCWKRNRVSCTIVIAVVTLSLAFDKVFFSGATSHGVATASAVWFESLL